MILHNDRKDFAKNLLVWWKNNKRVFPWRTTDDPYQVLIAEVLLHRTRAEQVLPVYLEFIEAFPTVEDLSKATLQSIRDIVHKLGLHWRTDFLLEMAQEIMTRQGGRISEDKKELESLPGIGDYIASALRCFAFNIADPLLDTNTIRILGRVFGVETTDASRRSLRFAKLYQTLVPHENPREFAFAIIDLGALVCTPRESSCDVCPVRESCFSGYRKLARNIRAL